MPDLSATAASRPGAARGRRLRLPSARSASRSWSTAGARPDRHLRRRAARLRGRPRLPADRRPGRRRRAAQVRCSSNSWPTATAGSPLLVESGLEFGSSLDLDQVLRSVAERMRSIADARSCDVYRLEGDSLDVADERRPARASSPAEIGLRYPPRRPHRRPGRPSTTGSPSSSPTPRPTRADRRRPPRLARVGLPGQRSSCPLVVHGEVIGLVGLFDTHPREFEHLDTLQGLAQIAAQALDNATLLEQAEDRTQVLRELVELGAIIWETPGRRSARRSTVAQRLADHDRGGVVRDLPPARRRAHVRDELQPSARVSTRPRLGERLENRHDYPTTFAALERHEVFSIASADDPGLTAEERRVFAEWGYESELVVPLVVEGRLVGMIDVFDTKPRHFESYLDFMRSVGQMVAGAFENAGLLEQLGATNPELETLVQSGLEFGSTLDLERVYVSVAERMRDVADAVCCDIYARRGRPGPRPRQRRAARSRSRVPRDDVYRSRTSPVKRPPRPRRDPACRRRSRRHDAGRSRTRRLPASTAISRPCACLSSSAAR